MIIQKVVEGGDMLKSTLTACLLTIAMAAQALGQSTAGNVIRQAAAALGGEDRILSIRTLKIEGYGQEAQQNGGGNDSASVDAPQRWGHVLDYEQTIDLMNRRIRIRQRSQAWLAAATLSRVLGNVLTTTVLDGDIPYTVNAEGQTRRAGAAAASSLRTEMLTHPVVLVRVALNATTAVDNLRNQGSLAIVDVTPQGDRTFTFALTRETGLPAWVSWKESDETLRDVTFQKFFTGFVPINGVMMPTGTRTVLDFRNVVQRQLYITRNAVDGPIDELAAPQSVRSGSVPPPNPPSVDATLVAQGIWLLHGNRGHNSILIEFADHLTMFEVPLNEEWTRALIAKARSVVPGKPLTEAIVSHHHFDHSGGVRLAIAEGLRIIAHRGTEDLFRELAARSSALEPDALSRKPNPLTFVPVGDHIKLRDESMEVDIYHIIGDEHMSEALMAYVPRHRLLIQGDLFDHTWQNYPWRSVYEDNVKLRNLVVERDVPVHGVVMPWPEVLRNIEQKRETTEQLCMRPEGPFLPACMVAR
jgi:glyoxylase-like metal-dependent hydrolase (beta-lactamase superfamily II)